MRRVFACILVFISLAQIGLAAPLEDQELLSYYDDSVFFGDSIMQEFRRYRSAVRQTDETFLENMDVIAAPSISLYAGSRRVLIGNYHFRYRGAERTMYQITQQIKPKKVFILLGMNDPVAVKIEKSIGWIESIMRNMAEFAPNVKVHFFSLTPVTHQYCKRRKQPEFQQWVDEYNLRLQETCQQLGAEYVEISTALKDEAGHFREDFSSDGGCHLSEQGIAAWVQSMKDYAQNQYDLGLWVPETQTEQVMETVGDEA